MRSYVMTSCLLLYWTCFANATLEGWCASFARLMACVPALTVSAESLIYFCWLVTSVLGCCCVVAQIKRNPSETVLLFLLFSSGQPRNQKDEIIEALDILKERSLAQEPNALFAVVNDVSKVSFV